MSDKINDGEPDEGNQPRCQTCRWWDNSVRSRDHADSGLCRAQAPAVDFHTGRAAWPMVDIEDWCAFHFAPAQDPQS